MIVSENHGNHTNELVQLFGRAQGNRRYCGGVSMGAAFCYRTSGRVHTVPIARYHQTAPN